LHEPAQFKGRLFSFPHSSAEQKDTVMTRWLILPLLLCVLWPAGCSSQGEKGINKDKDKPQPAEKK
jgi:hypothetical protein